MKKFKTEQYNNYYSGYISHFLQTKKGSVLVLLNRVGVYIDACWHQRNDEL